MNNENFNFLDSMTSRQIVKSIIITILTILALCFLLMVGSAYEQHMLCMNGATEYCIDSDFQNK